MSARCGRCRPAAGVAGWVPDGERTAVLQALIADIRAHQDHTTSGEVGYHYHSKAAGVIATRIEDNEAK